MSEQYRSRVYTDRPNYADFDAPEKFQAIISIIAKRLREHPKAICSYSGGADSDILIDLIERTRAVFSLPPVKYAFFNTGLEILLMPQESMVYRLCLKSCPQGWKGGKRKIFH